MHKGKEKSQDCYYATLLLARGTPRTYVQKSSLACRVLHRIAFPVISEWCQHQPRICMMLSPALLFAVEDGHSSLVQLTIASLPPTTGDISEGSRRSSGVNIDLIDIGRCLTSSRYRCPERRLSARAIPLSFPNSR